MKGASLHSQRSMRLQPIVRRTKGGRAWSLEWATCSSQIKCSRRHAGYQLYQGYAPTEPSVAKMVLPAVQPRRSPTASSRLRTPTSSTVSGVSPTISGS